MGEEVKRTFKEMGCCGWSFSALFLLVIVAVAIAGCTLLIEPPPTDGAAVATYNNQMFQMLMSILSTVATAVGFVGLWMKSNRDRTELAKKTDEAAEHVAKKAEETSQKIDQVAEQTKRAPARASDEGAIARVEIVSPVELKKED